MEGAKGDELGPDSVGSFISLMGWRKCILYVAFELMKGNIEMTTDDSKKHPVRDRNFQQLELRVGKSRDYGKYGFKYIIEVYFISDQSKHKMS